MLKSPFSFRQNYTVTQTTDFFLRKAKLSLDLYYKGRDECVEAAGMKQLHTVLKK